MMTATDTPSTPPAPRRLRKRVAIPALVLGALLALLTALWARGTVADSVAVNPTAAAEGVVTQLHLTPEGRRVVRCATIIERPMAEVWKVVTDYAGFERVFPTVRGVSTSVEPDGRHRFACEVSSILGTWPIDIRVRHQESAERCVASWDEPTGDVLVNRGSWTLSPGSAPGQTLVVYTLDVEVRSFPDFLVRAVLVARQKTVVEALRAHFGRSGP